MSNRLSILGSTVLLVLMNTFANAAFAKDSRWTQYGVRPLAMGNAFVSVADDFNALYYNPAGLARLTDWSGELINPTLEISSKTISFISDAVELGQGASGGLDQVLDLMKEQSGENHHFALQLTPYLIFPGFGLGLALDLDTTMAFHSDISAYVRAGPKLTIPVAFAKSFLGGRLSLGAGVKILAQGGIDREFSIQDISALTKEKNPSEEGTTNSGNSASSEEKKLEEFVIGGYALGSDIGMLFTPVENMRPTIGISITDIGGTPYKEANIQGSALGKPMTRLPSVNTGFSMRPIESQRHYVLVAIDAHSINQPIHYSKKLNFGAEYGLGDILKFQGGLYQGALTGGIQFDVKLLKLRLATYEEQLGSVSGLHDSLADRRYVLQLKLLI